ncbi:MAG: DUF3301 domain-containing protein [Idiomarina sp.]|nr:DUF3301 domain-containing protein [Idiomarina sp.]
MFDLSSVIMLAGIACIAALFWQYRRLGERAQLYAAQYCKQHKLQYLDIARHRDSFRISRRGPVWTTQFNFGFSSDREHRYEGQLSFANARLVDVIMPVYRAPDETPAASTQQRARPASGTGSYYENDTYRKH